jgi:hypothetical protein
MDLSIWHDIVVEDHEEAFQFWLPKVGSGTMSLLKN